MASRKQQYIVLTLEQLEGRAHLDPAIKPEDYAWVAGLYVTDGTPLTHPYVSPAFGDFSGLPPYLMPLVEVAGGARTAPDTVAWVAEFYRACGKSPLIMAKEVQGFVATRLQEALWREALHMVANGEATVEQIDQAVVNSPGPRWAFMGPCLTFHVGGGEGGMASTLDQFGPALKFPWTRLAAPELTADLRDRMVAGCEHMAAGRDFATLSREMNTGLVAIAQALKGRQE